MSKPLDFYFDFSSPYGYLAAMRIDDLAARYGRTVAWHPVLLGPVFKATGGAPLLTIPMKGQYSLYDVQRTARFHKIPYNHPTPCPIATHTPARAMLWIREAKGDDQAIAFAKLVFSAYFADGVHIGEAENVLAVAEQLGIDRAALGEGMASQPIKDRLKADVDQAMARGVFGAPFIFVDDEPFWGFDRFDQIAATLEHGKI